MTDSASLNAQTEAIADLLNRHIRSFNATSRLKTGGTKMETIGPSGTRVNIPFRIYNATQTKRTIR